MSETAKCDRCGSDTGKLCRHGDGLEDIALPMTSVIKDGEGAEKPFRFLAHYHLCEKCLKAFGTWWKRELPRGHVECTKCHRVCVLEHDGKAHPADLLELPAVCESCL